MGKNSEKYFKLIKLAQKFDACQNELLHYQKKEIIDKWHIDNSDLPSDDSSSMLNIKKVSKKLKRTKSCLTNNKTKENFKKRLNKLLPLNQKPMKTKVKTTDCVAANKRGTNQDTHIPKGKQKGMFPIVGNKRNSYSFALNIRGSRNIMSNNNSRSSSCNTHSTPNINRNSSSNYNNIDEKKFKLKRTTSINRPSLTKEAKKTKETTKWQKYMHAEKTGNKKKLKTQRQKKKCLKKKHIPTVGGSATDLNTLSEEEAPREKCSELLKRKKEKKKKNLKKKKQSTKKTKKNIMLRKKRKTEKHVDCNDSVYSASSVILEDPLNYVHLSKIEKIEQIPLSINENIRKWKNPTVPYSNQLEQTCYHNREQLLSKNTITPKRNISLESNDSEEYTTSQFIKMAIDEETKLIQPDIGEQYIKKHPVISNASPKHSTKPKETTCTSDNSNVCSNNNIKINDKNAINESAKKEEKYLLQSINSSPSKIVTDDACCNKENTHVSIVDNSASQRYSIFSKEKTSNICNRINVKSFKKLLKALDESTIFAITKKHQKKKSKLKNKRLLRKTTYE